MVNIMENMITKMMTIGVDISSLPDQSVEIPVKYEPKIKCNNKYIQKLLIKLFGYKVIYQMKKAKVIEIKADNFPMVEWDGSLEINFENERKE